MVNIVDGEHRLLLRSSGSQALSNQDFSVDKYPWIFCLQSSLSLCLYICVIVFVSLHLRIFVFVYLPSQLISFPGPHSCDPLSVHSPKFPQLLWSANIHWGYHIYVSAYFSIFVSPIGEWVSSDILFFLGCHCPRLVPWVWSAHI